MSNSDGLLFKFMCWLLENNCKDETIFNLKSDSPWTSDWSKLNVNNFDKIVNNDKSFTTKNILSSKETIET